MTESTITVIQYDPDAGKRFTGALVPLDDQHSRYLDSLLAIGKKNPIYPEPRASLYAPRPDKTSVWVHIEWEETVRAWWHDDPTDLDSRNPAEHEARYINGRWHLVLFEGCQFGGRAPDDEIKLATDKLDEFGAAAAVGIPGEVDAHVDPARAVLRWCS